MRHASMELMGATRGIGPYTTPLDSSSGVTAGELLTACGAELPEKTDGLVFASIGFGSDISPDWREIDCPACIALIRDATPPVRWDAIETLGLAPKLEAK